MSKARSFQEISSTDIIESLQHEPVYRIRFAPGHRAIMKCVAAFYEFLELPDEIKNLFKHQLREGDRGTNIGYFRRSSEDGSDDKEFFHYNRHSELVFLRVRYDVRDRRIENFFNAARYLSENAERCMRQIILALDSEFRGIYEKFFVHHLTVSPMLRFLRYDARPGDGLLAKGHYDRGGCALAIAESDPGLCVGKTDADIIPIEHREREALFMPALNLHKLTNGRLHKRWHHVVRTENSQRNPRWAIVYFSDPVGLPVTEHDEVYTPELQVAI